MESKKPRSMTLEQRKARVWHYKNNKHTRKVFIEWSMNQFEKYKSLKQNQQEVTNAN